MVLFPLSWGSCSIPINYYLALLAPLHLFICLYPHCAPGCIALGDHLWPAPLSRSDLQLCMTALPVVWSLFGSSKPYASLQSCDIATESNHIGSVHHNALLTPCIFNFMALSETSKPRNEVSSVQFLFAWLLEVMRLWPAMECVSSLEIMYWFLQTRSVSL